MEKPSFFGTDALEKRILARPRKKLVSVHVDCTHAPAHSGAAMKIGGKVVGTITSGDWGHRLGMNLAYGFVDPEHATEGSKLTVDVIGRPVSGRVIAAGPYDPKYDILRG
jgi:dimethylglycine dehydrogenase